MATIVGGVATSHTPTIAFAKDAKKFDDPVWKPIFEGYEPVQEWFREKQPDVLVYIYNDHMTSFFDHYSHFALGVGEEFEAADEGGGPRDIPAIKGDPEVRRACRPGDGRQRVRPRRYFQGKGLDHGAFSPLSVMVDHDDKGWACKLLPIVCGVLTVPLPSARRFWKFGKSPAPGDPVISRRTSRSRSPAPAALSHQVHGEGCGFNNPTWDHEFMELLEKDPESLLDYLIAKLAELGGWEGAEVVMWLMMRGALRQRSRSPTRPISSPRCTRSRR